MYACIVTLQSSHVVTFYKSECAEKYNASCMKKRQLTLYVPHTKNMTFLSLNVYKKKAPCQALLLLAGRGA